MKMKKLALVLAGLLALTGLAAGCGSSTDSKSSGGDKKVVLKVGASPVPHAEILNQIKPLLAKEGVDLQVVEFTDYVKQKRAGIKEPVFHKSALSDPSGVTEWDD